MSKNILTKSLKLSMKINTNQYKNKSLNKIQLLHINSVLHYVQFNKSIYNLNIL